MPTRLQGKRPYGDSWNCRARFLYWWLCDNSKVVDELSRLARDRKVEVNVLVDVDLGLKRRGVQPGGPAAAARASSLASA